MAEDATPHEDSPPPGPSFPPKPPREGVTIEGQATEIPEPGAEPLPEESAEAEPPAPEAFADEAGAEAHETAEPVTPPLPDAPVAPAPRPRRAAAFGWGLAGAVIGAAITVGAAYVYDPRAGVADRESALAASVDQQGQSVKTLEARLASVEKAAAAAVKPADLKTIEQRLAKLEAAPAFDPKALAAAQKDAQTARETAEKALAAAPAAGATAAAAAPVESDARVASLLSDEAALADRVGKLEASANAPRTESAPAATPAPDPRIALIANDEAKLSAAVAQLSASLGERIGKLEAALAPPKAETRVAPEAAPKADAASQAIAALALEQRLRAGQPYPAEMAALSRLGAPADALAALKPFADTGAPTASALAASFAKAEPAALAAVEPAGGDSVWDKLTGKARNLVRVHPVGEVAGEAPEALMSQIEGALQRGEVGGALQTWSKLPEPAKQATADWSNAAKTRAAADEAARSLREGAIARLAAAKS